MRGPMSHTFCHSSSSGKSPKSLNWWQAELQYHFSLLSTSNNLRQMHAKCETEARCGVCRLLITTQKVSCEGGLCDRLEWVNPCTSIWYGWWASAFTQCRACSHTNLSSSSSCPQTPSELLCSQCGHYARVLQLCLFSCEPVAQKAGEKNQKRFNGIIYFKISCLLMLPQPPEHQ